MHLIGPVGVGFAATGRTWHVRLHQGLVPFPNFGVDGVPLSEVTGVHNRNQAPEDAEKRDETFHPSAPAFPGRIKKAIFVPGNDALG
jgi:hypothetical protein